MKTTLNKIRKHSPCAQGWAKLLATLNKTKADDENVSFLTILESNGLDDALITAAPDLLDVLKRIVNHNGKPTNAMFFDAIIAIEKAEGVKNEG